MCGSITISHGLLGKGVGASEGKPYRVSVVIQVCITVYLSMYRVLVGDCLVCPGYTRLLW